MELVRRVWLPQSAQDPQLEVQQKAVAQQCKHAQANPFESLLRFTLLRVTIGKLRHQRRRGKLKYSSSHETLVRNSRALR